MKYRIFVFLALVGFVGSLLGCAANEEESPAAAGSATTATLHFSAIPDQNSTELEEKFQPLADYLSAELGVPVEYVPARDYQASVEMFTNGDISLGWFGGLTGVQARNAVPGSRAIAQGASDPEYYSYFIVHSGTGLERSEEFPVEIADLRFTFGSASSTSGRLMPEYFIRQATGQSAREFFSEVAGFSGSHDKTATLVESGQYQAGVLNYRVYDQMVEDGKINPELARIVWQTPTYADYNWTVHPQVEEQFGDGFADRTQEALVSLDDPDLLAAIGRDDLIPAANDDFEEIRRVAEQLDMVR